MGGRKGLLWLTQSQAEPIMAEPSWLQELEEAGHIVRQSGSRLNGKRSRVLKTQPQWPAFSSKSSPPKGSETFPGSTISEDSNT